LIFVCLNALEFLEGVVEFLLDLGKLNLLLLELVLEVVALLLEGLGLALELLGLDVREAEGLGLLSERVLSSVEVALEEGDLALERLEVAGLEIALGCVALVGLDLLLRSVEVLWQIDTSDAVNVWAGWGFVPARAARPCSCTTGCRCPWCGAGSQGP